MRHYTFYLSVALPKSVVKSLIKKEKGQMLQATKIILAVLLLSVAVFSQSRESQEKNYSESIPYSSRKINNQQSKSQPEKKNKINKSSEKQLQNSNDIKSINIPLSVFDVSGQPVENLQKTDVKIFIDNRECKISSFSNEEQPLNIILILDTSASNFNDIKNIKTFASNVVASLQPRDRIQIIEFNEKVKIQTDLTNDSQIINKAIKNLKTGNGTSLYDAVQSVFQNQINSLRERKTIILLSDAIDTTSLKANYETSLREAEKNDAVVFSFYLDTSKSNPTVNMITSRLPNGSIQTSKQPLFTKNDYEIGKLYLLDLALLSGGRAFEVENLSTLQTAELSNILNLLKPGYFITVETNNIDNLPPHGQIKVRVNRPNLIVQSRGSYVINND